MSNYILHYFSGVRGPLSSNLQEVDLPIVDNTVCQSAYADTNTRINQDNHICAGHKSGGKDTCRGNFNLCLVLLFIFRLFTFKEITSSFYFQTECSTIVPNSLQ